MRCVAPQDMLCRGIAGVAQFSYADKSSIVENICSITAAWLLLWFKSVINKLVVSQEGAIKGRGVPPGVLFLRGL